VLRRATDLRFRHAELGGDIRDVDEGREETCNIQHVLNWGNRTCLHIGYTLFTHWLHIGYTLVTHWLHIGYTLVTHWLHIGYTLVTHWLHIGYMRA